MPLPSIKAAVLLHNGRIAEDRKVASCLLCTRYYLRKDERARWSMRCTHHEDRHKSIGGLTRDYWKTAESHAALCDDCEVDG